MWAAEESGLPPTMLWEPAVWCWFQQWRPIIDPQATLQTGCMHAQTCASIALARRLWLQMHMAPAHAMSVAWHQQQLAQHRT